MDCLVGFNGSHGEKICEPGRILRPLQGSIVLPVFGTTKQFEVFIEK
jgi:hypothetical protein